MLKKTPCLVVVSTVFLSMSYNLAEKPVSPVSPRIRSFADLKARFKNPPASYGTVPFWVWNDRVTREEIDRALPDFKAHGFGGVFIHPRYGLITEYLSDQWFELVAYAVDKAKDLGLQIWLYDENSYPSGFAGGHVPAQMPESYNQGQGLVLHRAQRLPPDAADKYAVILRRAESGFVEVSNGVAPATTGDYEYFLFELASYDQSKWYAGFSYVDLLFEGVTEKFIEVTMSGYERAIGDEFGNTVRGIFTDEPHIRPPKGENCIRWTPALFSSFEQRWGYDLKPNLPSLFEETGEWQRVRHNYYATLLDLFIERWSKPWYRYCEAHNLNWTGHYWEHEWPNPRAVGDNMAMYAWHQVPGIDMLFNNMELRPDQFGNVRAVKELSSVANQLGKQRALSETYGAAGWELRFEDMKRLGDWEYVLGVNLMNQHLSFMTLKGDRKHDFPQSFSYHTPWWELYKPLAGYFARLSLALSSGEQINDILVLEPTTTAWMYASAQKPHERLAQIGDSFRHFVEDLERQQIEYDLGSENIIKNHGRAEGGQFVVGERAYRLVVLPPGLENLDSSTMNLMEQYLAAGGNILAFAPPPTFIDGAKSSRVQTLAARYQEQWRRANSVNDSDVRNLLASANFSVPNAETIGGQLFHQRRRFEDGELLFLVNTSLEESAAGEVKMTGRSVLELQALSGGVEPYPATPDGEQLTIAFALPPAGSLLLFVDRAGGQPTLAEKKSARAEIVTATGNSRIRRMAPNCLTLDYCDLKLGEVMEKGLYFYAASNKIFKHHGFEDNPWVSSSQFKTRIVDRDTFAVNSGFEATFYFSVDEAVDRSSLRAVIERPHLWQVSVNGKIIQPLVNEWWLDRAFGVFDISEHASAGMNAVTLAIHPMSVFAELEPVYIIGEFGLESQPHGWKLISSPSLSLGQWKEQGLPFYSNRVAYAKTYRLSPEGNYSVKLGSWHGTVAEVRVNGKQAGIIGWPPYELDISNSIADGENEIEVVVYGSLKNLLGPHHRVTRRGIVTPWSFKHAPDKQPAGKDYDLDAYGLFEDFEVIAQMR